MYHQCLLTINRALPAWLESKHSTPNSFDENVMHSKQTKEEGRKKERKKKCCKVNKARSTHIQNEKNQAFHSVTKLAREKAIKHVKLDFFFIYFLFFLGTE